MAMVPVAEWSWPTVTVSSVTLRPVVLTSAVGGPAAFNAMTLEATKANMATAFVLVNGVLCFIDNLTTD
jgi:hypothetical protein